MVLLLWPSTNAKCCPTFHIMTNDYGHSTLKASGLVPSQKLDSKNTCVGDRLEKQDFVVVFQMELRRRRANQRPDRFYFEKWQPIAHLIQQAQYKSTKVSCLICLLSNWPRILQFIYAYNRNDAKCVFALFIGIWTTAFYHQCNVVAELAFIFPSKRAIPRQNRSDRSQDRRESVPGQSVDCCITVLSGCTDVATIIDDVIALSSPKALFLANKCAGMVASSGVLVRFWQSC